MNLTQKLTQSLVALILCLGFTALANAGELRKVTLVNHQFEGTKQWVPGTIIAKKGDEVEVTLINKAPSGVHGFTIPEFNVKVAVEKGKTEVVKFKAAKAGIFQFKCHLHPAHIGGQLLVLE